MVRVDKSDSYMYIHDSDHYKEGIMVMPIADTDMQHLENIFPKVVRSIIMSDKYSMRQP
ncbi:hypothetical protein Q604_UNBC14123G0001, partial [human gut metagenome]